MNSKKVLYPLFLKILVGYVPIIILLGLVAGRVWKEERAIRGLEKSEHLLRGKRILIYHAFEKLLDLSLSGNFLYQTGERQYEAYREKNAGAVTALDKLRAYTPDSLQAARIDTIRLLLMEKQRLLPAMVELQSSLARMDSLMEARIPVIADRARLLSENTGKPEKKPGFFARLFHKKDKEDKQAIQKNLEGAGKVPSMLHSLHREFHSQRAGHAYLLALHTDSLHAIDTELNHRFSLLLQDLRQTAAHVEKGAQVMAGLREQSFRHMSYLSIAAVLISAVFYCFIMRDIRRRHTILIQLEHLNRKNEMLLNARKNMMLTVSHDLRTPLTAISGYAELLSGERQKEKRVRYSETIHQSAGRMLDLLNSLLEFYRLDTGKEQPDNKPFRLKALLEALENDFTLLAGKKRITFTTRYNGGDIVVTGDRKKILEIINNLLSNAIKFTEKGTVGLYIQYQNSLLTISVQDTGTGMNGSQIQRIFQPFERLDNAETKDGFGLGLSITLATAELLGGKIHVESEKGKGSLFTVHLPLYVTDEENPVPKTDKLCSLPADLRILVIDDDPVLLAMTMDMFSRNGISCKGCRNMRDLMELLRNHAYDLLITDIKMAEMTGYRLLELLRSCNVGISKTIPVLAATACADRNPEDFTEAGFAGCLYKPFSQAELLSAVQDCINRKQISRIPVQVDFSALLSSERNDKEMLGLLIRETGENMADLERSIKRADLKTISSVIHHLLPLWELIQVDGTLKFLQHLLDVPSGGMNRELERAVRDVIEQGNSIIRQARIKTEQTRDEQDTGHRG